MIRRVIAAGKRPAVLTMEVRSSIKMKRREWDFSSKTPVTVPELRDILQQAAVDDRIAGFAAWFGVDGQQLPPAEAEELRELVADFRARAPGKPTVAVSDSFGDIAYSSPVSYTAATAFEHILLQPTGDVGLKGFRYRRRYYKKALEKLGVSLQSQTRKEFKTAVAGLTDAEMSESDRLQTQELLDSLADNVARSVAAGRGMEEEEVKRLMAEGPYMASEALQLGLVDQLAYSSDVVPFIQSKLAGKGAFKEAPSLTEVSVESYRQKATRKLARSRRKQPQLAVVPAHGAIVRGSARSYQKRVGADSTAFALRQAADDDRVSAVILSVNSGGGSAIASDRIRHEVERTVAKKPVIAAMGATAASGGYYISMDATRIIAQPSTVTGSIGVLMVAAEATAAAEKAGVKEERVQALGGKGPWQGWAKWSEEEAAFLSKAMDVIYDDFVSKVARSREMSVEEAEALARGRIYSGRDALQLGLVDRLGGMSVAVEEALSAAGLPASSNPALHFYPRKHSMKTAYNSFLEGRPLKQPRPTLSVGEELLEAALSTAVDMDSAVAKQLAARLAAVRGGPLTSDVPRL